jgi:hypothetical protein
VLPDGNVYGVDVGLWRSIPNGHSPTTRTLLNIPGGYGVVWIPFTACVCTPLTGSATPKARVLGDGLATNMIMMSLVLCSSSGSAQEDR